MSRLRLQVKRNKVQGHSSCSILQQLPFVLRLMNVDSGGPGKHVLDRDEHWRYLVNPFKPSVCSGDAVFCQITLTTCS